MRYFRQAVPVLLLTGLITTACSVADDPYLRDTALNYSHSGFLSENLHQVHCSHHCNRYGDNYRQQRNAFIKNCRDRTVRALTEHKIRYDFHRRRQLDPQAVDDSVMNLPVIIDEKQMPVLYETYSDLMPGYLVYEKFTATDCRGTYRIQKEDLMFIVQNREIPFKYEYP